MKEFFNIIKKLWANKRTRAIAILILYVIFFIFVFSLLNHDDGNNYDMFSKISANYNLEFIGEENYKMINGNFYYNDELISDLNEINVDMYNPKYISNILDKAILESTNHIEKSDVYLCDINNFDKNILEGKFKFKIYKSENHISEIELYLKEYYGYDVIISLGV